MWSKGFDVKNCRQLNRWRSDLVHAYGSGRSMLHRELIRLVVYLHISLYLLNPPSRWLLAWLVSIAQTSFTCHPLLFTWLLESRSLNTDVPLNTANPLSRRDKRLSERSYAFLIHCLLLAFMGPLLTVLTDFRNSVMWNSNGWNYISVFCSASDKKTCCWLFFPYRGLSSGSVGIEMGVNWEIRSLDYAWTSKYWQLEFLPLLPHGTWWCHKIQTGNMRTVYSLLSLVISSSEILEIRP